MSMVWSKRLHTPLPSPPPRKCNVSVLTPYYTTAILLVMSKRASNQSGERAKKPAGDTPMRSLRVSKKQWAAWRRKAESQGRSLASWIRYVCDREAAKPEE
jgi:hypothetical protein